MTDSIRFLLVNIVISHRNQKHFSAIAIPEYYSVLVINGKSPVIAKTTMELMDAQSCVGRIVFKNIQSDFGFILQIVG